jgi:hypothetical protein
MAITDGNYIIGPKEKIFEACKGFAADLTDAGLELQPGKLACYIAKEFPNTNWDSLRGDIPNGLITDVHGNVTIGLAVCNVPAYLARKGTHIRRGFNVIKHLFDPGRWPHPDIPARQILWILTLACLQFTGDYWIRHVQPDYTIEFAQSIDAGVKQLFQMCVGVDINSWSEHAQEPICLPIRLQGCGL